MSGDRIAYLDPQEKVWPRQSGGCFKLSGLQGTDALVPFNGIENFNSYRTTNYSRTLFRFPLRNRPSDLSDSIYNVDRLVKLIDVLKDEAMFLLLFLHSVQTIEVYSIDFSNKQELNLRIQVPLDFQAAITQQRTTFLSSLRAKHTLNPYGICQCISDVAKLIIEITDASHKQTMSWLIANQVGSSNKAICDASKRQNVLPWVGVAMKLDEHTGSISSEVSSDGRVFCFLPMPVEASSKLPVHVNGTFALSDDRRTIKWPEGERRNDSTAQWNKTLVEDCLPSCYNLLLRTAVEDFHITPELFYNAWPCISSVSGTFWSLTLTQLFEHVFQWECLCAQSCNKWVRVTQAIAIPKNEQLAEVIRRVLTLCDVPLCDVPDHVFEALEQIGVVHQLSSSFVCSILCDHPTAYQMEQYSDKLELLHYCLKDENFHSLSGLELLPVANHTFRFFNKSTYYICSKNFPRKLLPNLDHKLVDLLSNDEDLHDKLTRVARSERANLKLKCLSASVVADLLPQCYPQKWKDNKVIQLSCGDQTFPYEWCETFWTWIQHHNLSLFVDKFVVPLVTSNMQYSVNLTKLSTNSAVVLIQSDSFPNILLKVLAKLGVLCTIVKHASYLQHRHCFMYFNLCNPGGVLTAVFNSYSSFERVSFSHVQASKLQDFLASQYLILSSNQQYVLERLCIFHVLNHPNPVSLLKVSQSSWKQKAVLAPHDFCFRKESLPSNMVLLSFTENRRILLQQCEHMVSMPDSLVTFLLDNLFPMIHECECPEDKVDQLMIQVLQYFPVLKRNTSYGESFKKKLASLPFIHVEKNVCRKATKELYDCSKSVLKDLFHGLPVFPLPPFDQEDLLVHLRECELQTTVQGQNLVDILMNASSIRSWQPKLVTEQCFTQVKAVLAYIGEQPNVLSNIVNINQIFCTFDQALITQLSSNWLPVLATPPNDYPQCLTWRGRNYSSHLVSLNSLVQVCRSGDLVHLSCIVGSQMYIVECPDFLVEVLRRQIPIKCILDHLFHVVNKLELLPPIKVDAIVHKIYKYLNDNLTQLRLYCPTSTLRSQNLIWMKKQQKFVVPDQVVVKEHPTFQHSLAPFYQMLPESLHEYSKLFAHFGVHCELTDSDIMLILRKINDDKNHMIQDAHAWQMIAYILNWVTDCGTTLASEKLTDNDILFVPIQSDLPQERPQLVDANKVVYTNLEFLRYFEVCDKEVPFIHENFLHLASFLGVKPLSEHLNVSQDAFGDVGPHEPLVTRLKNILQDYKDGLTIVKELLQNADDAGATEVTICYDARTHSVKPKSLIFPGMVDCHGPALLVHNNVPFTDQDLENITKLAGATKTNEPLKIGKFGVGFCSVYHITDIPSFISGKWLYIFDPTIRYLKKEISDRTKPGKKLSFIERIVDFSKQLVPYQGLFAFEQKKPYHGTLFRFPFRTSPSELSDILYNKSHVQELLTAVKEAGSKLLLFLNKVRKISFSHVDGSDSVPSVLYSMEKATLSRVPPSLGRTWDRESHVNKSSSCLAEIQEVTVNYKSAATLDLINECWLVACEQQDFLIDGSIKSGRASVASYLHSPSHCQPKEIEGDVFCYLPLSHHTGLPVHISANFAVLGDRTGIHVSDSESPDKEVQWNINLMQSVIPKAFHSLLTALQSICTSGQISVQDYDCYSLWPLKSNLKVHNPWDKMIHSLYNLIATSDLFYSSSYSKWLQLQYSRILSNVILLLETPSKDNSTLSCVVKVIEELHLPLINLPIPYHEYFAHEIIHACIIDEEEFLKIFFNNINVLPTQTRNEVLVNIFQVYAIRFESKHYIEEHLIKEKCVPCSPDGAFLKKCSEIIDPCASFSDLFDSNDGVFPFDDFHNNSIIHLALLHLNIINTLLPWQMIVQRVEMIPLLHCVEQTKLKALQRTALVLNCIEEQLKYQKFPSVTQELSKSAFLPVMKRPTNYPKQLKWCGDGQTLLSSQKLLKGENNSILAGSQVCIVTELDPKKGGCGPVPTSVATALEIGDLPSCISVVKHLLEIVDFCYSELEGMEYEVKVWIDSVCKEIYKYFEQMLFQGKISVSDVEELKNTSSVWTGNGFIQPNSIAICWNHQGPFLYSIPHTLASKHNLIRALDIQSNFTVEQYLATLEQIYYKYDGHPIVGVNEFKTISQISSELAIADSSGMLISKGQICYLPDTKRIMRITSDLAFNDAPWCQVNEDSFYVHQVIQKGVAFKLGVSDVRCKALQPYMSTKQTWGGVNGQPFGQHEELTQRIQNILSQYPRDITILKELLQNSDDAKATKMYVILDKRKHGTKRLPSREWQDLQGPALLIWNDSYFSEEDLKGIQELGVGGKRSSSESIGYHGVGFNVVYHLTDCPSFITNGNTLCVLDPHCRYIPVADEKRPGWQFNGIDDKFWDNFTDLKSSYLHNVDEIFHCPKEIFGTGTLFRLPLRHSTKLVRKSKLVNTKFTASQEVIATWDMEMYLKEWAPKMKEALLFLNNVKELKFFTIEETNSKLIPTHHYNAQFTTAAAKAHHDFFQKLHALSYNCDAVTHYKVCLVEEVPKQEREEWLIQQGIGDIQSPGQHVCWQRFPQERPRHGIAARISGHKSLVFVGQVFCFLPLPLKSGLPVHINGNFALDSARNGLWQSRGMRPDDRQNWNLKLIEAIASSYIDFLVVCQRYYVSSTPYHKAEDMQQAVNNYYRLFPSWHIKSKPEGEMLTLAHHVYKKLSHCNSPILAVTKKKHNRTPVYLIQWLCLVNKEEPSKQVFFWKRSDKKGHEALPPVLRKIGIQLTLAPNHIWQHFADIDVLLPQTTEETMFKYYCSHYDQVSETFPCSITETKFESVEDLMKFVRYIVQEKHFKHIAGTFHMFPSSPSGIPLLITADKKLRRFSEDDKVICSKFSHIFTGCLDKFVHPEMYKLKLVPEYFISPSRENWKLISHILKEILPESLRTQRISNANIHINIRDVLIPLWNCIDEEEVIHIHLEAILQEWALLLSNGNELFSCKSQDQLIPIIPHKIPLSLETVASTGDTETPPKTVVAELNEEVFQILKKSGMPILDTEVVKYSLCEELCPQITQHARILQNLCQLYHSNGLQILLQDKSFDRKVAKLFNYFGYINFAKDQASLENVKSLPFFKNIDNTYCCLTGETLAWPGHICLSGKAVWMKEIRSASTVFLKSDGAWCKVGETSVLGINKISPLSFYTRFILPHFHNFSDEDRLKQLQHIRDTPQLFSTAYNESNIVNGANAKTEGTLFINALKRLPCLVKNGQLRPVSEFCDHNVSIFKVFAERYDFLPDILSDKKWLEFFYNIGLKTEVTKAEFLMFCKIVSTGQHSDLSKASNVLMNYLFKQHKWHKDKDFLKNVSELPFVQVECLPDLAWISPIVDCSYIKQQGKGNIRLTSLCKAAVKETEYLVWTTMSVVQLPRLFYNYDEIYPTKPTDMKKKFYRHLQICTQPSCKQVVDNILNISRSRFANFKLFETHSQTRQRNKEVLLLEILVKCFTYLSENNCPQAQLCLLQHTPCIPVSIDGRISDIKSMVLVSPLQVIADTSGDVAELVPFLNPLPKELYPAFPDVLLRIDVRHEIIFDNVQLALQLMNEYQYTSQPLDVNTISILKKLIRKLYFCLDKFGHFPSISEVLYLPNNRHQLVKSTELFYNDREHYREPRLDFPFLSLLVDMFDELNEYGFRLKDLYKKLPDSVKPALLSAHCIEKLSIKCKPDAEPSEFAMRLKQAFEFPDFAKAVKLIIQALLSDTTSIPCEHFAQAIVNFHQSVEVFSVFDLEIDVYIKLTEEPTKIGSAKVDFLLECDKRKVSTLLYVDSRTNAHSLNFFEFLASSITLFVAKVSNIESEIQEIIEPAVKAVEILLKGPSPAEIRQVLNNLGMSTTGLQLQRRVNLDLTPKLGESIPEEWHHHLYYDIHNVFRPQEWVGYEYRENHFIFARIEYHVVQHRPTLKEEDEDCSGGELDVYRIVTGEDDEDGKEVTVIELYKFLQAKELQSENGTTEIVLYDPGGETVLLWDSVKNETLKSMMEKICRELRQIGKIKDNDRKMKAIKAMYLNWQPDKISNPFATEAFQFLRCQIKRLKEGKLLEDPDTSGDLNKSADIPDSSCDSDFKRWDKVANIQKVHCDAEKSTDSKTQLVYSHIHNHIKLFQPHLHPDSASVSAEWFKQAEYDFEALQCLLHEVTVEKNEKLSAHVCFMAHQVAEKALKASTHKLFGCNYSQTGHNLQLYAKQIESKITHRASELLDLTRLLDTQTYYFKTRYPDEYSPPSAPSEHYKSDQAQQAEEKARRIMDILRQVVQ